MTKTSFNFLLLIFVFFLTSVSVGFRADFVGSDTLLYTEIYNSQFSPTESLVKFEYLYNFLSVSLAFLGLNVHVFFTLLSLLSFVALVVFSLLLSNRFFLRNVSSAYLCALMGLFLFLSPVFLNAQTNVIRQGVSLFYLYIFFISILCQLNWGWSVFFAAISVGFHYTSAIYIALFFLLFISYRLLFYFSTLSFILYISGFSEKFLILVSGYAPIDLYGKVIEYGVGHNYLAGVRVDFAVFTFVIGCCFSLAIALLFRLETRRQLFSLFKVYWILVLPFFYLGFGAFSDRYLLGAWLFVSIMAGVLCTQVRFIKVPFEAFFLFFGIFALFFISPIHGLFS
jgi:hypothetical protein